MLRKTRKIANIGEKNTNDIRHPLLAACVNALQKCPCSISWREYYCGGPGLLIDFEAVADNAHNFDFNPIHGEWGPGVFPHQRVASFFLRTTGVLQLVGEDEFSCELFVRRPSDLIEFIEFFRNAAKNIRQTDGPMATVRRKIERRARQVYARRARRKEPRSGCSTLSTAHAPRRTTLSHRAVAMGLTNRIGRYGPGGRCGGA